MVLKNMMWEKKFNDIGYQWSNSVNLEMSTKQRTKLYNFWRIIEWLTKKNWKNSERMRIAW